MFYVYDLRRDGFTVYTGISEDLGRSLARHLASGRKFDSLYVLERAEKLEAAKWAAENRRYILGPTRRANT